VQREYTLHKSCSGSVALKARGADVPYAQQPGTVCAVVEV
jgi:hypothetical protein